MGHVRDIADQILRAIVEEVQEETISELEDEEDENEENLLNESEEEVEDTQESIDLPEDIHSSRDARFLGESTCGVFT